jgi:hypothetical protein
MAKQDWSIEILVTEAEGDKTSNHPWYNPSDIQQLIRGQFRHAQMPDLTITSIKAKEVGTPYV